MPPNALMTSPTNETTPQRDGSEGPRLRDAVVLALLLGLFFALFLGSRPLSVPDEGRYVEIPREMAVTGDWLTPRLNGVKYFEKPPLFYWFEAALIRLFGLSEWSVRLGPALFALVLAAASDFHALYTRAALTDALEQLTDEDILEEVLANNHRYKPEPLFSKTGVGSLSSASIEERAQEEARSKVRPVGP